MNETTSNEHNKPADSVEVLRMEHIVKSFPGVKALKDVNFDIRKGEIHALVGENGAGKSTLMKVLSGVHPHGTYSGDIYIYNKPQSFKNTKESEKAGVSIIYQELTLVKTMNVCENIFLGDEKGTAGIINWDYSYAEASKLLAEVGLDIQPQTKVLNLGVGVQQLVEIAKALGKKNDILILDEPTAALSHDEANNLLKILEKLRRRGVSCVFISHRLKEVMHIADRVTVLRDGSTVGTYNKKDLSEDKIISLMVGRDLTELFPYQKRQLGDVVLEVKDWQAVDAESGRPIVKNASFNVRAGEILGVAGLVGAGRTEFMMNIFRVYGRKSGGTIVLNGKNLTINSPSDAIEHGLSLLSEDRKRYGLVLMMDIKNNISLAGLNLISTAGIIDHNAEIAHADIYTKELQIKTPSIEQKVRNLSGGNQQKVVIAKWLLTKPKVLILDEPTRGIDVGAKIEIYNIMNKLAEDGAAIIMISSELPEILGMSDRIIVMCEGRLTGELNREEATQEKIMKLATTREIEEEFSDTSNI